MSRKRADRNRARRRWKEVQAIPFGENQPTAKSISADNRYHHSQDLPIAPILDDGMEPSPWFPEFDSRVIAKAHHAAAMGEDTALVSIKKTAMQRLEMRAVSDRWPIPKELKHKMIIDAATIMSDTGVEVRNRLLANRLLVQMDAANRTPGLPNQVNVTQCSASTHIDIGSVVRQLMHDPHVIDALDARPYRPVRGSSEDYAD